VTCDFAEYDGVYVLGALSPDERRAFEAHLQTCPACAESVRALAGLPGLLARVPAADVATMASGDAAEGPPPELLPALLARVTTERARERRQTRQRFGIALAAAACVAALAGGTVVALDPFAAGPPKPVALQQVVHSPLTAEARLSGRSWGTDISLHCKYHGQPADGYDDYLLVAIDRSGHEEQVAAWQAVADRPITVPAASSISLPDLARLEVRTVSGSPILKLTL
jgi:hypothetical protein